MDPNERQPQSQLPVAGPATASTSSLAPPEATSNHATARNASPSPSRRSVRPSTPLAEGETGTEYFPPLDVTPSLLRPPSNSTLRAHSNSNASSAGEAASAAVRQPSIRIRRRSSSTRSGRPGSARNEGLTRAAGSQDNLAAAAASSSDAGEGSSAGESARATTSTRRQRSISQPERAHIPQDAALLARRSRRPPQAAMPRLTEEGTRPTMEELNVDDGPPSPARSLPEPRMSMSRNRTEPDPSDGPPRLQGMRRMSRFFWPRRQSQQPQQEGDQSQQQQAGESSARADEEYNERLVDYLDTIDPEVQTLSTLTNVQNSLFVPDLGKWVNRRPTYALSDHDFDQERPKPPAPAPAAEQMGEIPEDKQEEAAAEAGMPEQRPRVERTSTITSRLTESHYAALPHGTTLDGWTAEEKMELDDHVRHMLHSRRSKFKRRMKGFGQYVRRPLGFLVTLYATLITLFGLAWVLFLIGWIYVGDKQVYVIHVIDSVLVALFAVMGDGLAPFRAIDTYHMIFVLHYARIVKKGAQRRLEKQDAPPEGRQSMELAAAQAAEQPTDPLRADATADLESAHVSDPHAMRNNIVDGEDAKSGIDAYEDTPLTYAQQKKLHHHQKKLAKSHSFYKPNETSTHFAFPLNYLTAIVILLDCHSCLQISLGACTWGIDYRTRPFAITTVILCVSITCNITAGIVISIGDRKTRKKDVWTLMNRQELTGDAMRAIEQKRSNSNKADKTGESDLETEKSKEATYSDKLVKSPS